MNKILQVFKLPGYILALIMALITILSLFFHEFFLGNLAIVITMVIILLIILLVYIEIINQENRLLKKQVENNHLSLIDSHERLAKVEIEKEYIKLFENFVNYDSNLFNIQMYKYSIHPIKRNKIDIRINYVMGYTEHGHNLNVLMQGNYTFINSELKRLRKVLKLYEVNKNDNALFKYHIAKAGEIKSQKMFKDDYNILPLLSIVAKESGNSDLGAVMDSINENLYEDHSHLSRKTELVQSIIKKEFLNHSFVESFEYKGIDINKQGRKYFSVITKNMYNEKIIFLFTVFDKENIIDSKEPAEYYKLFREQLVSRNLIKE